MFSSAEELLEEGETIQKQTSPSRYNSGHLVWFVAGALYLLLVLIGGAYAYFKNLLGFNPLLATLLIPGILVIILIETKRNFVKYYFSTNKIIKEKGILNKKLTTIRYDNITHVELEKKFEERIFDVGDLHIDTAGTDETEQVLNGLKDPESYRVLISEVKKSNTETSDEVEFDDGAGSK